MKDAKQKAYAAGQQFAANQMAGTSQVPSEETPIAERAAIVIAGDRNAGKSSLMNALFERNVAIVSQKKGTTTDPVLRKTELKGLGPVSITDTAGLDDTEGDDTNDEKNEALGRMRVAKTLERLNAADLVLFATNAVLPLSATEKAGLEAVKQKKTPVIIVATHSEKGMNADKAEYFQNGGYDTVNVCVAEGVPPVGIDTLISHIEALSASIKKEMTPLEGLVKAGDVIVLVMPQDSSAPKARLILPQVETLRDALDKGCITVSVSAKDTAHAINALAQKPNLVITDSQAFSQAAEAVDPNQQLTSFSILFARKKGDMEYFIKSLDVLSSFPKGGKVLIMEACNHHRQDDDIGTVKIPALFHKKVDSMAHFDVARELPPNISEYSLVIHCAACMATRAMVLERLKQLKHLGIPVINYGLFLAWANGLFPRAASILNLSSETV